MKKTLIVLILGILTLPLVHAQKNARDRIESMKIGYLTQKLNLTSDEAQKFWPIYNKYNDEMEKLRRSVRSTMMEEAEEADKLSEKDAEKLLNELLNFKEQEHALTKKYASEFKKAIPSYKIILLYKAENDFKRELLKKLRERR